MSKWDVRSFIMKKRSCMPKCHLQQLKDAVVDSTNPLFASFRERSGLILRRHEVGDMNTHHAAPSGNLATAQGNTNGLQENQSGSTLVRAKRSINASTSYEKEIDVPEAISLNSSAPCARVAKKFKQEVVSPVRNTVPDLMLSQKDRLLAESSGGSQPIVQKGNLVVDEAQVGAVGANGCLKDGSTEYAASRSVLHSSDSNHNELLHQIISADKFQNIGSSSSGCAEQGTSSGSSQLVIKKSSCTDELKHELGYNLRRDLKGATENIVQSHDSEFSSDTDEYHNEITDVAAQKIDFMDSQNARGEDSLTIIDCSDLNLCLKCNEGRKLLVCSSDTCQLAVHESCLTSVPKFDHKGNFYCPFCAYSQAISEYLKSKKEASLARKELAAFIGLGAGQGSEKLQLMSQATKHNQSQQYKNEKLRSDEIWRNSLNEVTEAGNAPAERNCVGVQVMQTGSPQSGQQSKKLLPRSEGMKQNQSQPDKNAQSRHNEKGWSPLNEVTEAGSAPANGNCVGAQVMQKGSPQPEVSVPEQCVVAGQQPDKTPLRFHKSRPNQSRDEEELCHNENKNKNFLEKVKETASGPVDRSSVNTKVMQMHPPRPLPHEFVCHESSSIEESSEEEEDGISSRYFVQFRNPKDTFTSTHQSRRKKLQWTKVEEEMLKEGVVRFSNYPERWKKILEFGCDVFQKGRTAVHLYDKWRSINKGKERAT